VLGFGDNVLREVRLPVSIEYKLCTADKAEDLNKEVNQLLADGWALYGIPFVTNSGNVQVFCQALTKSPTKVAGIR